MRSKVEEFQNPQDKKVYAVQVFENGSWSALLKKDNSNYDHANPIRSLNKIPLMIRKQVKLYIARCKENFAANKVS